MQKVNFPQISYKTVICLHNCLKNRNPNYHIYSTKEISQHIQTKKIANQKKNQKLMKKNKKSLNMIIVAIKKMIKKMIINKNLKLTDELCFSLEKLLNIQFGPLSLFSCIIGLSLRNMKNPNKHLL